MENSTEKAVSLRQEEEEEEEALSLCDLPMIHDSRKEKDEDKSTSKIPPRAIEIQEDFDFCSLSKESEMCAADEVFFQGQILPLRHSVSSERGLLQFSGSGSISRSESMEYYSSRSSSISSSHQSSSSGSSSASTHPKPHHKRPKQPQNQFHSHPSPSPRLSSSNRHGTVSSNNRNCTKKTSSAAWNIFRLGLVTAPPEIALQDLKTRCPTNNSTNCKNFGSRNSTGSNTSSLSSNSNKISPDKKKKPRSAFLSGCMCTNDAVDTVSSEIAQAKRSASESELQAPRNEDENENVEPTKPLEQQAAKKHLSHHRTFEWLRQLSVEGTADEAA
ncbi:hypothetical protein F511_08161 [Dorcoceras hygrometricum]|uniref:Uncharacterized protein n=1 Tax=Dorcoceras hygrometricum TaxID=472368 RepID=A0A2Z7DH83_9LAMI|nr:hypothetical protein F511_08161 [Dorcoceras hygrometricum]